MAFADDVFPISIVGEGSVGPGEGTVNLSQEGSTPAASIPVHDGQRLVITDFLISSSLAACEFIIQQTQDGGATWHDVVVQRTITADSGLEALESPRVVKGGVNTAIRVRATPDGGAVSDVSATLLGRLENIPAVIG